MTSLNNAEYEDQNEVQMIVAEDYDEATRDKAVSKKIYADSTWLPECVSAFLDECIKKKDDIHNPLIRRRQIFSQIRKELKAKGYRFSTASLDKKLSNMKVQFHTSLKSGRTPTWPYFKQLKTIYPNESVKIQASSIARKQQTRTVYSRALTSDHASLPAGEPTCSEVNFDGDKSSEDFLLESEWNPTSVNLFLDECIKRKDALHNIKIRRSLIFADIRNHMREKGFFFTIQSLNKKLSNLKIHYQRIPEKKTGKGINWLYFNKLEIIYGDGSQSNRDLNSASSPPGEISASPHPASVNEKNFQQSHRVAYLPRAISAWNSKSVNLFLDECIKRKSCLNGSKVRRRQVFSDIRKHLAAKGYPFKIQSLIKKLYNMKSHFLYINNKKNNRQIQYPYYDKMKMLYSSQRGTNGDQDFCSSPPQDGMSAPSSPLAEEEIDFSQSSSLMDENLPCDEELPINTTFYDSPNKMEVLRRQILSYEERRTVAAEKILNELRKSNKLKRELLDINMKLFQMDKQFAD